METTIGSQIIYLSASPIADPLPIFTLYKAFLYKCLAANVKVAHFLSFHISSALGLTRAHLKTFLIFLGDYYGREKDSGADRHYW